MKENDFIDEMMSFVGVQEVPLGSNLTRVGEEFGWNGVAWCAETVSDACKRLGFPLHEAAVISIEKHAKAGDYGLRWISVPTRGAITCFDFGGKGNPAQMHTGVVKEPHFGGQFYNIEGNHRDRCEVVFRDMKFVRGFALPPFESATPPTPSTKVQPMFDIKLPPGVSMLANLKHPTGGEAILLSDGGVLCFDSPFNGNGFGKPYLLPNHKPARLAINPKYTPDNGKPWYIIVDNHGHEYGHDGF